MKGGDDHKVPLSSTYVTSFDDDGPCAVVVALFGNIFKKVETILAGHPYIGYQ